MRYTNWHTKRVVKQRVYAIETKYKVIVSRVQDDDYDKTYFTDEAFFAVHVHRPRVLAKVINLCKKSEKE